MNEADWIEVVALEELKTRGLLQVDAAGTPIALSYQDGQVGAISGRCNHAGGPLGEGRLEGDFLVCPWHYWKFHRCHGGGEPGYEADQVPAYAVKIEAGKVLVDIASRTARRKAPHEPHPLARPIRRKPGGIRVLGIATTQMSKGQPRYSTSDALLDSALAQAQQLECETRLVRLRDLSFRACEGFYSKSAHACTWPCSITQMDPTDEMEVVYEGVVHWADAILVTTPIRWGNASSLYYRMVERMNCIQNQETIADRVLLKNKAAGFIVTGGQDNVQAVVGQMLGFFSEIGCQFPQFPFIAHSRGWTAEDMENNIRVVKESAELHAAARELCERTVEMARLLVADGITAVRHARGGRKGHGDGSKRSLPRH